VQFLFVAPSSRESKDPQKGFQAIFTLFCHLDVDDIGFDVALLRSLSSVLFIEEQLFTSHSQKMMVFQR
jgi:hypothetical protein